MRKLLFLFGLLIATITVSHQTLLAQTEGEGSIYMVEEIYFFDELDYAFYQTYNAFLNGQDAKSGARLRRAAYFVRQEAKNAEVHNKKPIERQAKRLESLADSIALGRIQSARKLQYVFGRTHNILAKDYKIRAAEYWAGKKAKQTGHAMVTAAGHLGHAAKWTGKKVEKGVVGAGKGIGKAGKATGKAVGTAGKSTGKAVVGAGKATGKAVGTAGKATGKAVVGAGKATGKAVGTAGKATGKVVGTAGKAVGKGAETAAVESYRGIRWLGGKMIQGVAFVPEKVGQGLEWLGKGIDKVGENVEPTPKKNKAQKKAEKKATKKAKKESENK